MDAYHDPFPALTPANCSDMLPGWTDDMVNMVCATVFIRTGVHVDAEDMRAGIERAIANG